MPDPTRPAATVRLHPIISQHRSDRSRRACGRVRVVLLAALLLEMSAAAPVMASTRLAVSTTTSTTLTTTTTLPPATPAQCGDANDDAKLSATDALIILQEAVGVTTACTRLVCDVVHGDGKLDGTKATDALVVLRTAVGAASREDLICPSMARVWDEQLLAAIRLDTPRPTVHARNLFHLSIALWDAWVVYDSETAAVAYLWEDAEADLGVDRAGARNIAMSFAAYRILSHRFRNSAGRIATQASLDATMDELGLDRDFESTQGGAPAAVGNRIAAAVLAFGAADGANEAADYADDTGYAPVNQPCYPALRGTTMAQPNRWQPLSLEYFVTQNGIPLPISVQTFISPNWDNVTPFALVREVEGHPYVDPGMPPLLGGEGDAEFKDAVLEVIRYSSWQTPDDGVMIDISPASSGNNPLGTNDGAGYAVNPVTGQPYEPMLVKRGDWGRILAEFWADGPDSETPPGHWNVVANYVADHPATDKRIGGTGDPVDDLEWDVKTYLALNGAVHDAAVASWGAKAIYDYVRPISMIRYMGGRGQSSNPGGPSYHPSGLPLEEDLVEVVTVESSAPGQRHAHLAASIGEIAIRAWLGNPEEPETEYSGVGWILAEDWVPYQRETFVTPAFAGYVSGHSTFSRAGAEVMTRMTGSAFFPGGLGQFHAPANDFLEFETGPTEDITLEWATYQDAADEAGLSRLYGGIHVRADDFGGRIMGYQIGQDACDLAAKYWDGSIDE